MLKSLNTLRRAGFAICTLLLLQVTAYAQGDVTQPGDSIIASSANSPGSEAAPNALDDQPTKYLNFDTVGIDGLPSGFVVTPGVGKTVLSGLAMQSANDAPERDPKWVRLEGSNDEAPNWLEGDWTVIYENQNVPPWSSEFPADDRFQTQTFEFGVQIPYLHYRWTVVEVQGETANSMQIAEVEFLGKAYSQKDVTQPGDPIIASSANSPGSEAAPNALDNQPTKYLNFDTVGIDGLPSGFVVTPGVGKTVLSGLAMQSANDAPDRDPKWVRLEGSNDEAPNWLEGNWTVIYENENVPAWSTEFPTGDRFQTQTFEFGDQNPYLHYRWTVLEVQGEGANSMQIAEVEFLGQSVPVDVTQPGDSLIASSGNSPGSEAAPNALDNQPTKYLNFDTVGIDGLPSGFVVTPAVGETNVVGLTMQSANDAPDRDPLSIRLEGSNDTEPSWESGNWEVIYENEEITPWSTLFPTGDRFQTQEFYFFDNAKSYLHYRWTVLQVQGEAANSMQIAEVELLAFSTSADCDLADFLIKPVETPVLLGESAEFFTKVNGPWPLQWHKNGEPIPGAIQASYKTDPINAENAGDEYSVEIVGCEMSEPVKAVIFQPNSQPVSIGINFVGGGANGAPTSVEAADVGGVSLQAYWNNLPPDGAGVASGLQDNLLNSRNEDSGVTVEWISGNTWGAGTGTSNTDAKLLNGLIEGGDSEGTPSTITFTNVPDGTYSMLVYSVARPLEFPSVDFEQVESSQKIFMTEENADAYNSEPGYRQVTSIDSENRGTGNYVRFDDIIPAEGTVTLNFWDLGDGAANSTVNALQLIEGFSQELEITSIDIDPGSRNITITWASRETGRYIIERSTDLLNWDELDDSYPANGDSTTFIDAGVFGDLSKVFYRVTEE